MAAYDSTHIVQTHFYFVLTADYVEAEYLF